MPESGDEDRAIPLPPSADQESVQSEPGLLGSLRQFADTAIGTIEDRVELLSVELQEEKSRMIRTLVWIIVFACTAVLAVLFLSGAIVLACWNTRGRLAAIVALGGAYTLCAIVAGVMMRGRIDRSRPFAGTREELRNDRTWVRPKN
jgi:uncharacterized membrane protein YqjE